VGGWRDICVLPEGNSAITVYEMGQIYQWDLGLNTFNEITLHQAWSPGAAPEYLVETSVTLNGVWCTPADAFVVGQSGAIVHRGAAGGFQLQTSGTTAELTDVWGRGSTSVWAVGEGGTILNYTAGTWERSPAAINSRLNAV